MRESVCSGIWLWMKASLCIELCECVCVRKKEGSLLETLLRLVEEYACVREWLYIQWPTDGFWNACECVFGPMLFSARRCLCRRAFVCVLLPHWAQCVESGCSAVLWLVSDEDDEEKDSVEPHSAAPQSSAGPSGLSARGLIGPWDHGAPCTLSHTYQRIWTHRALLITGAVKQVASQSSCSVFVILNRQHFQWNTFNHPIMTEHLHMRWPDYVDHIAISASRNALVNLKFNESLVTECRSLIFKYSEDLKVYYIWKRQITQIYNSGQHLLTPMLFQTCIFFL